MTASEAIEAALIAAGYTLRKDQAALLGLHAPNWHRYLAGRSPQECTIRGWLTAMEVKGIGMELVLSWEGVRR